MSKICILIHGYLSDYRDFTALPAHLLNNYDQMIMLNIPGHQEGNINEFTRDRVFDYINNELTKVQYDKESNLNTIDVIGFSLGGALTWYIARHYKLRKIVLLSPALYYLNFGLVIDRNKYISKLKKLPKEEQDLAIKKLKQREKEARKFAIENTIHKFKVKNAIEFIKIINKIRSEKTDINVPMLLIRGKLDELIQKKIINVCLKHNTNDCKVVYEPEDIGHMMLRTDRAEEIITKIKDFLEDK